MSESTLSLGGDSSEGSDKRNNIFYAPDNGNPQDLRGRAFAVTGTVNMEVLLATTEYLRTSNLFQAVHHGGGTIFRIAHKPGYYWNSPLLFPDGRVPNSLPTVRERLNEHNGDITMLAYVISVVCDAMGWNAPEVTISELNFG